MADLRPGAPLALLALLSLAPQAQAQWRVTPSVGLTETYSDNPGLLRPEEARSSWITTLNPALALTYGGPRLKLNGTYTWSYYHYSRDDPGTRSNQRAYQGAARAIVIDELLFVDASATRTPRSISAFGPQLNDNPYALANSRDTNSWSISPNLRRRFGASADLTLRYTLDSVDAGVGAIGSSEGRAIDLDLVSGTRFRALSWGGSYRRQEIEAENAGTSRSDIVLGNLNWQLARTFSLTASAGYDRYDYEALGGAPTQGSNWSTGFDWVPSARTRLKLSGGKHFYGNTWNLAANHRSRRTAWSAQYTDGIINSREQFLRPDAVDAAAMVDALLRNQIPDDALRAAAVADYLKANGLTPGLGGNAAYFANRFLRQQSFNTAVIFNGARATLTLAASDSRRNVLSTLGADASVPALPNGRLDDNVHQRTVSAIANYRITPRSSAQASVTLGRSRSLTTDLVDNNRAVRLGATRQFSPRLTGALELRHVRSGAVVGSGRDYRENAISAVLTMQFKAR
jgi:uncharacterized protein (PEP-CTERM system associated)